MAQHHLAAVRRLLSGSLSRRQLARGLAGAGAGWGATRLGTYAAAKRRTKETGLCRENGSPCRKPGSSCRKRFCLSAPFTITAAWTEERDHDAYVFVPPQSAATGPSPYIYFNCTPETSTCEEAYPFACLNRDARGPGDEITTIYRLLPGRYEYWVDLYDPSPASVVTVTIRTTGGRVVRQWSSPDTTALDSSAWHVFDIDGRTGGVLAIDELAAGPMPDAAHDPPTSLCSIG